MAVGGFTSPRSTALKGNPATAGRGCSGKGGCACVWAHDGCNENPVRLILKSSTMNVPLSVLKGTGGGSVCGEKERQRQRATETK
jgi:hypothetical protein